VIDRQATAAIRPAIDALARVLVRAGASANALSFVGLAIGWLAAVAIALHVYVIGAVAILLSRLFDGLDGAVARQTTPTDRGGFLDARRRENFLRSDAQDGIVAGAGADGGGSGRAHPRVASPESSVGCGT